MDDVVGVGDEGDQRRAHARQHGAIKAELERGFLDAVAQGFQCCGNAESAMS